MQAVPGALGDEGTHELQIAHTLDHARGLPSPAQDVEGVRAAGRPVQKYQGLALEIGEVHGPAVRQRVVSWQADLHAEAQQWGRGHLHRQVDGVRHCHVHLAPRQSVGQG